MLLHSQIWEVDGKLLRKGSDFYIREDIKYKAKMTLISHIATKIMNFRAIFFSSIHRTAGKGG